MSLYTYAHAYTRAQALVDQVAILFNEAGINNTVAAKICHGVENHWLQAVAVYLARNGKRVYEAEIHISWEAHSDQASYDFSTDLPGWEGNGSPEAVILGRRFAQIAKDQELQPTYWVLFTPEVRSDPALYRRLCGEVGVIFGSSVEQWAASPQTHSLSLQDLREVGISERNSL